jgi:thymidylate kinase
MKTAAPKSRRDGRVVVAFTGPDGSGKSTQVSLLARRLERSGLKVECVHQYEPVTEIVRRVKQALRSVDPALQSAFVSPGTISSQDRPEVTPSRGHFRQLEAAILSRAVVLWWLLAGCWRQGFHVLAHSCDVVIMDRCFIDELVRAQWKLQLGRSLGRGLMRLTPSPDIVFELTVEEAVAWNRKKAQNMARAQYGSKRSVTQDVLDYARGRWSVRAVSVSQRSANAVSDEIFEYVTALVDRRPQWS